MSDTAICEWCGESFERPSTRGPLPKFCKQSHRQRAYEGRHPRMTSDPLTDLGTTAVQMHELFTTFVAAGFTEDQAMQLLIAGVFNRDTQT